MLAIGIILLCLRMVCSLQYIPNLNTYPNYDDLLEICFNLIIGVELIRMMYSHSPSTVFEVLLICDCKTHHYGPLFHLQQSDRRLFHRCIICHTENSYSQNFDIADKTIFRASTKAKVVAKILSLSIPHEADDTLSNVLLRSVSKNRKYHAPCWSMCISSTIRSADRKKFMMEKFQEFK